jgi:hypothetical protein
VRPPDQTTPALVRSDIWILAALVIGAVQGPVEMQRLWENADYLMRRSLTFDEVSFGVPRLVAAGLAEVSAAKDTRLMLTATPKAVSLTKVDPNRGVIDMMFEWMDHFGCRPHPEHENEDRSLGRLSGLDPAIWPDS